MLNAELLQCHASGYTLGSCLARWLFVVPLESPPLRLPSGSCIWVLYYLPMLHCLCRRSFCCTSIEGSWLQRTNPREHSKHGERVDVLSHMYGYLCCLNLGRVYGVPLLKKCFWNDVNNFDSFVASRIPRMHQPAPPMESGSMCEVRSVAGKGPRWEKYYRDITSIAPVLLQVIVDFWPYQRAF